MYHSWDYPWVTAVAYLVAAGSALGVRIHLARTGGGVRRTLPELDSGYTIPLHIPPAVTASSSQIASGRAVGYSLELSTV